MVAVRGKANGGVVIVEVFSGEGDGAVGENDVVFDEAFFYGGWGRDYEDFECTKAEEHDRAVFFAEFFEGSVDGWLH